MEKEYVGIDLHRRRSVIYRMDQAGDKIDSVRVDNEPNEFAKEVSAAPAGSDVILEATYGWYWAADLLKEMGYEVHLANPHGNDWGHRRVKNDERDARDLADLLRLGRLAEAWIAPPKTRELREMIRFRIKLSHLRTGLKAQVHAVMAKNGILPAEATCGARAAVPSSTRSSSPTPTSTASPCCATSSTPSTARSASWTATSTASSRDDAGYNAVQAIYGVGRIFAAIFVAEIGDVTRFDSPKALCSWAGLTPKHKESDTHVHRGRITKQGSRLVRWAAIEAVARYHGGAPFRDCFEAIAERRGKNRANVAIARKVLTLVYYGLRDGEIRCLADQDAA